MTARSWQQTLLVHLAVIVLTIGRASVASGAPEPQAALTLKSAIEHGVTRGPAIIEASRNREAASQFARHPGSSLPSVPQATILAGARSPYNLPVGPEIVLTVQQEVSLRGLGAARARAADWAARVASSEVDRARLEGAATAALAWIDLLESQGLLRLRTSVAEDAARLARIAEIRVASGVATAVERSLAQAEVGAAQLAILDGEGRATQARLTLSHATGTSMEVMLQADGELEHAAEPRLDARAVVESIGRQPVIRAAEARAGQAAAEGSVAHAIFGPTFSFGASAWREGSGDHAAAAIVSVPLPFFDPARHDLARQAVVATAASSHAVRLRGELERETRLALHERDHTREVQAQLRDGVVMPLRNAVRTAIMAYAAGTNDLGVVLLTRRSALAAEEHLLVAAADVWRADIRLAALAGTLVGGTP